MQRAMKKRSTATKGARSKASSPQPSPPQSREDRAIYRAITILEERMRKPGSVMTDPLGVKRYLRLALRNQDRERFMGLFLDSQHQLIETSVLSEGTLDSASIYPREVVKLALSLGAAAVIFAHNHPSGSPEPSTNDRVLTDRLRQALALVDIRVLDHFVIGNAEPVSFAERGWI